MSSNKPKSTPAPNLPQGKGSPKSPVQDCPLNKKLCYLTVTISREDGKPLSQPAKVKLIGPSGSEKTTALDSTDFDKLEPGDYQVSVTFPDGSEEKKDFLFELVKGQDYDKYKVKLKRGDSAAMAVKISPIIEVKPKIKMEYKTVLFEPNLGKAATGLKWVKGKLTGTQDASEEKIYADPTCILLYLDQPVSNRKYAKGGKLKCSPANVEIYLDKEGKNKLSGNLAAGVKLTNKQLTDPDKQKFYLWGKTAGKYDITLELEDPADKFIKKGDPVTEKMGVVKLEMKLHEQNVAEVAKVQVDPDTDPVDTYYTNLKDKVLPDQKELTDVTKIKPGRLLHLQKDGNFGRAKVVLKKAVAAQWPDGCDDYEITLDEDNISGGLEVYDKEVEGTKIDFPVKVKYSDLKADDKTFWVEGKEATKKWREAKLDAGLDRPDDVPVPVEVGKVAAPDLDKEPKRNGDWGRFTVVEIKEVKIEYKPVAGKAAAWDAGNQRFYINVKSDPDGRKVTISAKLSEKFKDVTLHFMLAPDKDNMKTANWGIDLPGTWKWKDIGAALKHKDRSDRKNLLHLSAKTDAEGYAKVEVSLSRFAGDKFQPAVYLDQDPHLAKYIDGHADLGKRKPVFSTETISVWRKIWYQMTYAAGFVPPAPGLTVTAYQAARVGVETATPHQFPKAGAPARTFYPEWMIKPGGGDGDVAVIGNHNKRPLYAHFKPKDDQPVKAHLVICEHQWDPEGNTDLKTVDITSSPSAWITMSKSVIKPPLDGGAVVVTGTWETTAGVPAKNGTLTDADIIIEKPRTAKNKIKVKLPAGTPVPTVAQPIKVKLTLKGAADYLGESSGKGQIMIVYDSSQVPDYNDTISHEIGHALEQTPNSVKETIPAHPNWDDLGQGVHCLKTKCIMYKSGPQADASHLFCEDCHPYMDVQNMTKLK
jgi:hypothetical protein